MKLSNLDHLDEAHARKYRRAAVALLGLTTLSLVAVFVGLYKSSPFITLFSLVLTGVFLFSAFFAGGVGLTTVARQGARVVYRSRPGRSMERNEALGERLEESEGQEGLRVDSEPPYMTDFPEEDHPPERGR